MTDRHNSSVHTSQQTDHHFKVQYTHHNNDRSQAVSRRGGTRVKYPRHEQCRSVVPECPCSSDETLKKPLHAGEKTAPTTAYYGVFHMHNQTLITPSTPSAEDANDAPAENTAPSDDSPSEIGSSEEQ
ncbi:hypothetical protein Btru_056426 [Bulinus truncatus]|nr:hypothetical protein Btru_056426 [Bulinus truncatus]